MNVSASSSLELVTEPVISDTKLRYHDILHKRAETDIEVPGRNMRTIAQIGPVDLISRVVVSRVTSESQVGYLRRNGNIPLLII
jgi:hypothetical protein